MAVGLTRDVSQHQQVTFYQAAMERTASPFFAPPVPRGMIEPGTNYYTIITAEGPHTTEHPGVTGGTVVMANNRDQKPVERLTRKGG